MHAAFQLESLKIGEHLTDVYVHEETVLKYIWQKYLDNKFKEV
jgi:hypothetical protein